MQFLSFSGPFIHNHSYKSPHGTNFFLLIIHVKHSIDVLLFNRLPFLGKEDGNENGAALEVKGRSEGVHLRRLNGNRLTVEEGTYFGRSRIENSRELYALDIGRGLVDGKGSRVEGCHRIRSYDVIDPVKATPGAEVAEVDYVATT